MGLTGLSRVGGVLGMYGCWGASIQAGHGYAGVGIQVWVYRVGIGGSRLQGCMYACMVVMVVVVRGSHGHGWSEVCGGRCRAGGGDVCKW